MQNLFQLQKFFNQREKFKDCFPEFVEKYRETEKQMDKLFGKPFAVRAKPRIELMNWFLEKIKHVENIDEILEKIPDEELFPIDGNKYTKDEFLTEFYPEKKTIIVPVPEQKNGKKIIKIVANFHAVGGGEMSVINLAKMFIDKNYSVHLHPTQNVNSNLKNRLVEGIEIKESITREQPSGYSDILLIYCNDFAYKLTKNKKKLIDLMNSSRRNVVCVNFVMGETWQEWFSSRVDKFLFLNTTKEHELLKRLKEKKLKEANTHALAPPVFTNEYLQIMPNYDRLDFVRSGRYQGKYEKEDYLAILKEWKKLSPESEYHFMATPPFVKEVYNSDSKFHLYAWDSITIPELLSKGSLFHYHLPKSMKDQGPRVICEAQLSGIPCCVSSHSDGPKDRVNNENGWLCETVDDFINVVKEIKSNPEILKIKGENSRKWAIEQYNPENWIKEIIC